MEEFYREEGDTNTVLLDEMECKMFPRIVDLTVNTSSSGGADIHILNKNMIIDDLVF